MKRLWIQLSLAFAGMILLASTLSFLIVFTLSWLLPEAPLSLEHLNEHYKDFADPFVAAAIIEGQSDEAILKSLQTNSQTVLIELIKELRLSGYAEGIDVYDRSFGRIFRDFIDEFFNDSLVEAILYAALIGITTGIIMSRRLAQPLEILTRAVQTLGQRRLNARVKVSGSQEIEELGGAFNQMAEQLEQQEQLRQNMLADVSHELRTPLTALEGQLRGTLDGVFELTEERVADFYSHTNHLIRLVEDLRLLAQAEARQLPLEISEVNVEALLKQTLGLFHIQAEDQGVFLTLNIPSDLPSFSTDEQRLRQVLHNLIANALKHTLSGDDIQLYARVEKKNLTIGIKDSGSGIAKEHIEYIFNRFYRVDKARDRNSGGSGLGLAIVKSLVEMLGGEISVHSNGLRQGSDFQIQLPL